MHEEHLTRSWKIGCAVIALLIASVIGWISLTLVVISHDKSLNSRVEILWMNPMGAPLGIVVPSKNRWMENSFIAEASHDKLTKVAVLILDDRGGSANLDSALSGVSA